MVYKDISKNENWTGLDLTKVLFCFYFKVMA